MERLTAALRRLREGALGLADGRSVYYQDDDTLRDAADLYAVLAETHATGSPNLENEQARGFVERLQSGGLLADVEIGRFLELLDKYADEIAVLRASPDRQGQDYLHEPDPSAARIQNGDA